MIVFEFQRCNAKIPSLPATFKFVIQRMSANATATSRKGLNLIRFQTPNGQAIFNYVKTNGMCQCKT